MVWGCRTGAYLELTGCGWMWIKADVDRGSIDDECSRVRGGFGCWGVGGLGVAALVGLTGCPPQSSSPPSGAPWPDGVPRRFGSMKYAVSDHIVPDYGPARQGRGAGRGMGGCMLGLPITTCIMAAAVGCRGVRANTVPTAPRFTAARARARRVGTGDAPPTE